MRTDNHCGECRSPTIRWTLHAVNLDGHHIALRPPLALCAECGRRLFDRLHITEDLLFGFQVRDALEGER